MQYIILYLVYQGVPGIMIRIVPPNIIYPSSNGPRNNQAILTGSLFYVLLSYGHK